MLLGHRRFGRSDGLCHLARDRLDQQVDEAIDERGGRGEHLGDDFLTPLCEKFARRRNIVLAE